MLTILSVPGGPELAFTCRECPCRWQLCNACPDPLCMHGKLGSPWGRDLQPTGAHVAGLCCVLPWVTPANCCWAPGCKSGSYSCHCVTVLMGGREKGGDPKLWNKNCAISLKSSHSKICDVPRDSAGLSLLKYFVFAVLWQPLKTCPL